MYEGAYAQKRKPVRRRRRRTQKPALLLTALVLIFGALVGSTVAFLFTDADPVTNTFQMAKVATEITEDFDNSVKNNVYVNNIGDVPAYIRVAVVVTWQNDKGEVHPNVPAYGVDYAWVEPEESDWTVFNGYYYYTKVLNPGMKTDTFLFTNCQPVEDRAPDDYHLSVEILASAIQSDPASAVQEAWGVTIADGKVTAYTAG